MQAAQGAPKSGDGHIDPFTRKSSVKKLVNIQRNSRAHHVLETSHM